MSVWYTQKQIVEMHFYNIKIQQKCFSWKTQKLTWTWRAFSAQNTNKLSLKEATIKVSTK